MTVNARLKNYMNVFPEEPRVFFPPSPPSEDETAEVIELSPAQPLICRPPTPPPEDELVPSTDMKHSLDVSDQDDLPSTVHSEAARLQRRMVRLQKNLARRKGRIIHSIEGRMDQACPPSIPKWRARDFWLDIPRPETDTNSPNGRKAVKKALKRRQKSEVIISPADIDLSQSKWLFARDKAKDIDLLDSIWIFAQDDTQRWGDNEAALGIPGPSANVRAEPHFEVVDDHVFTPTPKSRTEPAPLSALRQADPIVTGPSTEYLPHSSQNRFANINLLDSGWNFAQDHGIVNMGHIDLETPDLFDKPHLDAAALDTRGSVVTLAPDAGTQTSLDTPTPQPTDANYTGTLNLETDIDTEAISSVDRPTMEANKVVTNLGIARQGRTRILKPSQRAKDLREYQVRKSAKTIKGHIL